MVSKARLDLPEPESPVITTSRSRGRSRSMFLRLCSRAPRIEMNLPGAGAGLRSAIARIVQRGIAALAAAQTYALGRPKQGGGAACPAFPRRLLTRIREGTNVARGASA